MRKTVTKKIQDVDRTVLPLRVVTDEVPMALATGLVFVAAWAPVFDFVAVDLDAAFFTITVLLTFGAAFVVDDKIFFVDDFVDVFFDVLVDDLVAAALDFAAAAVGCFVWAAVRARDAREARDARDALFGTDVADVATFVLVARNVAALDLVAVDVAVVVAPAPADADFRTRLAAGSLAFAAGCADLEEALFFGGWATSAAFCVPLALFATLRAASTAFSLAATSFSRFSNSLSRLKTSCSRLATPASLFFASVLSDASLLATAFSFSAASFSRFLPSPSNSLACFSRAETRFSAAASAFSTPRAWMLDSSWRISCSSTNANLSASALSSRASSTSNSFLASAILLSNSLFSSL